MDSTTSFVAAPICVQYVDVLDLIHICVSIGARLECVQVVAVLGTGG